MASRSLLSFLLVLTCIPAWGQDLGPRLEGCWQRVDDPSELLRFEPERVSWRHDGRLDSFRASYGPRTVNAETWGQVYRVPARLEDGTLELDLTMLPAGTRTRVRYHRVQGVPPSLSVEPMRFGPRTELSDAELARLRAELRRRRDLDQAVRKDRSRWDEMRGVDADNTAWLQGVVERLGWIDARRFGARASNDAFLLVQHSADLSLMLAALPEIKRDFDAGHLRDPQPYALLHDRVQVRLGKRQRYGTQLGTVDGQPVVLPLEDRARVEELRAEIGLFPMKRYLEFFERDGRTVRFLDSEPDPAEAPEQQEPAPESPAPDRRWF